ncbi:MAG: ArsR family transcriptional regulator [Anaerolineales bacterium]|jgi:DNA-binding IclR family transcriptional regulator
MLDFVKALAHADRLKIVGMLAQKPAKLSEIAAGLSLPSREVFSHLAFLEHVGVVHITEGFINWIPMGWKLLPAASSRVNVQPILPNRIWDLIAKRSWELS